MSTTVVKRCSCGAQHTAAAWLKLRLVGHTIALKGQAFFALELRECTCGSCITRRIVRTEQPAAREYVAGNWGDLRSSLSYAGAEQHAAALAAA